MLPSGSRVPHITVPPYHPIRVAGLAAAAAAAAAAASAAAAVHSPTRIAHHRAVGSLRLRAWGLRPVTEPGRVGTINPPMGASYKSPSQS